MLAQMIRTLPLTLTAGVSPLKKVFDTDGEPNFTLAIENLSTFASLTTKGDGAGSPEAKMLFTAVARGTGGNSVRVAITAAASQALAVSVSVNDITIALACDAAGNPISTVQQVMAKFQATGAAAALATVTGVGSASGMGIPTTQAFTALAGGAAATVLGAVTVEFSDSVDVSNGANGPWVAHAAAGTALSTAGADTTKSYTFGEAAGAQGSASRFMRVTVTRGAADSVYSITAIRAQRR